MRLPPDRRLDLLAVLADERPMKGLLGQLQQSGFVVDVARDLPAARTVFVASGGHLCVLVGPDVAPGLADAIVDSLREVDPELPAVRFGPRHQRDEAEPKTASLSFHPSSRAGMGAFLRFLRNLPERG